MENNKNTTSGGVGFTGFLTILFIALKLTHKIDWNWVWVLSPLWISVAIYVLMLMILGTIAIIRATRRK